MLPAEVHDFFTFFSFLQIFYECVLWSIGIDWLECLVDRGSCCKYCSTVEKNLTMSLDLKDKRADETWETMNFKQVDHLSERSLSFENPDSRKRKYELVWCFPKYFFFLTSSCSQVVSSWKLTFNSLLCHHGGSKISAASYFASLSHKHAQVSFWWWFEDVLSVIRSSPIAL